MRYRVWDTDINRLFGTYETEEEALALVRVLAPSYGEDIEDLAMTFEHDDGTFFPALWGFALLGYVEWLDAERMGAG